MSGPSTPTQAPKANTTETGQQPSLDAQGSAGKQPPAFQLQAMPIQREAAPQLMTTITLSAGVGAKGPNVVSDLKAVQGRLKDMGFLAQADFDAENTTLLKDKPDTDKIPATSIPKTIAAIKEYERVVIYQVSSSKYNKPTGQIDKNGQALGMMNTHQVNPDAKAVADVTTARTGLKSTVVVGGELTLSGKVGNVSSANKDSDLEAVQQRLVGMGKMKESDRLKETPAAIAKANPSAYPSGTDSINSAHIPLTIKAIESFQTSGKFDHSFWQKRKFKGAELSGYKWTKGQVAEGDLSEFILSHYEKVTFTFQDGDGKDQTTTSENFYKAADTKDAVGYSIVGSAEPSTFTIDEFKAYGITDLEARALLFVSKNEGKFNAVNTWDGAAVSFGFIQSAGGSGGGSFPKMMANLKMDAPTVFESKFKKYGIDVEYTTKDSKVATATIVALDTATGKLLRGVEAEAYIRQNPGLIPAFLSAGYDKDVQKAQVKTAVSEYVIPSRSSKFNGSSDVKYVKYKQGGKEVVLTGKAAEDFVKTKEYADLPAADKEALATFSLKDEKISDYLSSEKARAVIIDLSINAGLGGATTRLSQGMAAYVTANNTLDKATLKTADEVELLKSIKPYANFPERVQKAIDDSSLSGT